MTAQTALLALHYQNDVLHSKGKIRVGIAADSPERGRLIAAGEALLGFARARSMPVVHVRVAYRPDGADIITNAPIFRNVAKIGAVQEGSWGAQFYDSLAPVPDSTREFVVKHSRINAFFGSQLEEVLRVLGVSQLLVAGVATHSVVESTVRHAVDMGFEVSVAADACSAADPAVHRAALQSMSVIAQILDTTALEQAYPLYG
ncbi:MAG TPA: isochorismatase family cysteine hydrolase [Pusillimonas sp.]|uniref:cysteine hydrolase family protein n=1 Tax=Pusillimonas sp. TaxID=3040095 RepID=UPI002D0ED0E2|nr:isochorismatase family cysteine hydrolase [Pusillimonas sp.]HUH87414.1 isochorismatase family cysteine hydrolase [Pusillimonas sp.]